jgi:hemerythrin-like domain-containing protein
MQALKTVNSEFVVFFALTTRNSFVMHTGWVHAHDAIRLDMKDIAEAVESTAKRLTAKAPEGWEADNIKTAFKAFYGQTHKHHDHEEELAFPFLSTRIKLPEGFTTEHESLIKALDDCSSLIEALTATSDAKAWDEITLKFKEAKTLMEAHLRFEEDVGLPLMRYAFNEVEVKNGMEKKIVAQLSPLDLGWFLRHFPDDNARREWMTKIAGIPGPVQSFIMLPAMRKWNDRVFTRYLIELKSGDRIHLPPTTCCVIS